MPKSQQPFTDNKKWLQCHFKCRKRLLACYVCFLLQQIRPQPCGLLNTLHFFTCLRLPEGGFFLLMAPCCPDDPAMLPYLQGKIEGKKHASRECSPFSPPTSLFLWRGSGEGIYYSFAKNCYEKGLFRLPLTGDFIMIILKTKIRMYRK